MRFRRSRADQTGHDFSGRLRSRQSALAPNLFPNWLYCGGLGRYPEESTCTRMPETSKEVYGFGVFPQARDYWASIIAPA